MTKPRIPSFMTPKRQLNSVSKRNSLIPKPLTRREDLKLKIKQSILNQDPKISKEKLAEKVEILTSNYILRTGANRTIQYWDDVQSQLSIDYNDFENLTGYSKPLLPLTGNSQDKLERLRDIGTIYKLSNRLLNPIEPLDSNLLQREMINRLKDMTSISYVNITKLVTAHLMLSYIQQFLINRLPDKKPLVKREKWTFDNIFSEEIGKESTNPFLRKCRACFKEHYEKLKVLSVSLGECKNLITYEEAMSILYLLYSNCDEILKWPKFLCTYDPRYKGLDNSFKSQNKNTAIDILSEFLVNTSPIHFQDESDRDIISNVTTICVAQNEELPYEITSYLTSSPVSFSGRYPSMDLQNKFSNSNNKIIRDFVRGDNDDTITQNTNSFLTSLSRQATNDKNSIPSGQTYSIDNIGRVNDVSTFNTHNSLDALMDQTSSTDSKTQNHSQLIPFTHSNQVKQSGTMNTSNIQGVFPNMKVSTSTPKQNEIYPNLQSLNLAETEISQIQSPQMINQKANSHETNNDNVCWTDIIGNKEENIRSLLDHIDRKLEEKIEEKIDSIHDKEIQARLTDITVSLDPEQTKDVTSRRVSFQDNAERIQANRNDTTELSPNSTKKQEPNISSLQKKNDREKEERKLTLERRENDRRKFNRANASYRPDPETLDDYIGVETNLHQSPQLADRKQNNHFRLMMNEEVKAESDDDQLLSDLNDQHEDDLKVSRNNAFRQYHQLPNLEEGEDAEVFLKNIYRLGKRMYKKEPSSEIYFDLLYGKVSDKIKGLVLKSTDVVWGDDESLRVYLKSYIAKQRIPIAEVFELDRLQVQDEKWGPVISKIESTILTSMGGKKFIKTDNERLIFEQRCITQIFKILPRNVRVQLLEKGIFNNQISDVDYRTLKTELINREHRMAIANAGLSEKEKLSNKMMFSLQTTDDDVTLDSKQRDISDLNTKMDILTDKMDLGLQYAQIQQDKTSEITANRQKPPRKSFNEIYNKKGSTGGQIETSPTPVIVNVQQSPVHQPGTQDAIDRNTRLNTQTQSNNNNDQRVTQQSPMVNNPRDIRHIQDEVPEHLRRRQDRTCPLCLKPGHHWRDCNQFYIGKRKTPLARADLGFTTGKYCLGCFKSGHDLRKCRLWEIFKDNSYNSNNSNNPQSRRQDRQNSQRPNNTRVNNNIQ